MIKKIYRLNLLVKKNHGIGKDFFLKEEFHLQEEYQQDDPLKEVTLDHHIDILEEILITWDYLDPQWDLLIEDPQEEDHHWLHVSG